jgi:periplasmic protein CpxP/Spy
MKPSALLAAAALAFAVPAFALAQAPQGQQPADGAAPGRHGGHGDWAAKAQAMRQQRMQDLHIVLRIRPEQESAFQAFEAAMAPPPRGEHERGEHTAAAAETTPQAIDQMAAWQAKREQRMAQRGEATKRFYAALSPEQQQVFDALRRLSHEHRGGRHGFGGGRGFGHGPMGGPEAG